MARGCVVKVVKKLRCSAPLWLLEGERMRGRGLEEDRICNDLVLELDMADETNDQHFLT
ncbi:unnamed protein product [Dovyalis caffra]|uniref:Uncharacterized protein n=1 Tax=Dovyalis caffra TaxID=77055 RepID=A0AAV1SUY1_9ROSI|nr:unnamed protein product [Dovyalis caffra]